MPLNILVCPVSMPTIFDKFTPVFPFRSTLFDPNTAFIRPVLLYLPVHHALSHSSVSHPLLVPFPFLPSDTCPGMIQDIIFRAIPSLSFFVILPLLFFILFFFFFFFSIG